MFIGIKAMTISSALPFLPAPGFFYTGGDTGEPSSKSSSTNPFDGYKSADTQKQHEISGQEITRDTASRTESPVNRLNRERRSLTVGHGGTLWSIAGNYDVIGATRYQKMVAI